MKTNMTNWNDVPLIMDLPTVSSLVGLNPNYLAILARKNELPAFKVGDSWRVDKEDLLCYISKQKEKQKVGA